ncbi:GntR family transcriptional regulator [Nocardioides sp. Kera G14]|uniref:GntR family transcriptional regulator n=1 Tax=Nocardioides sp. Kera G14 TaxID=2884264 RepID=UPI001D100DFC|nr:GntR family transcriptional regulator [Nocardioides sp. Kera G14]UDY23935.1 GntR family transcriptional regulator [Nocardioides sp. Kera G14]
MNLEIVQSEATGQSSRSVQAYEDLRNLIVSGHFVPNARLTEAELTTLLDVSRGTVRSVIVRLAQEGYLTREPNRGVRTRLFTVEEAAAVLEARETLESALAGKCAERATDSEVELLGATWDEMREADQTGDAARYSELNRAFHRYIREGARQPIMVGFVDRLMYPLVMRQFRDQTRSHPRANSLGEHEAILAAIRTRNADAAAAAMRHHVSSARRALLLSTAR